MLGCTATQQRLVFVIFARQKSADDLYASHGGGVIFIGKRVADSGSQCCKGTLVVTPLANRISIPYPIGGGRGDKRAEMKL